MSGHNQILPGTGRWCAAPEGGRLIATRSRPAPPTMLRMVPLPVNGEDL